MKSVPSRYAGSPEHGRTPASWGDGSGASRYDLSYSPDRAGDRVFCDPPFTNEQPSRAAAAAYRIEGLVRARET